MGRPSDDDEGALEAFCSHWGPATTAGSPDFVVVARGARAWTAPFTSSSLCWSLTDTSPSTPSSAWT